MDTLAINVPHVCREPLAGLISTAMFKSTAPKRVSGPSLHLVVAYNGWAKGNGGVGCSFS